MPMNPVRLLASVVLLLGTAGSCEATAEGPSGLNTDDDAFFREMLQEGEEIEGAPADMKTAKLRGLVSYDTKDPVGIYCKRGFGQTRSITTLLSGGTMQGESAQSTFGEESITEYQINDVFCHGKSYCMLLYTDDVEVMKKTFPPLGDIDWDGYYSYFFAYGCEGDWQTDCEEMTTGKEGNDCARESWKIPPQVSYITPKEKAAVKCPDSSGIVAEGEVNTNSTLRADAHEFKKAYCCSSHFCSPAHAAVLGSAPLTISALLLLVLAL